MADIALLSKIGKVTPFDKNQVVFMQNDPGEQMYLALSGSFGVYINSFTDFPVRVAGIQNGLFFGEMSVIDGWPRSATIISEEDGRALIIDRAHFEQLLTADQTIAAGILHTLNDSPANAVQCDQCICLYGDAYFHEQLLGLRFELSPFSWKERGRNLRHPSGIRQQL